MAHNKVEKTDKIFTTDIYRGDLEGVLHYHIINVSMCVCV